MKKEDILKKAVYVEFPSNDNKYKEYNIPNVNKLNLPDKDGRYSHSPGNYHHFTTKYTYSTVLPLLSKLFNFNFSMSDFEIKKDISNEGDFSFIVPKKKYEFDVYSYEQNLTYSGDYLLLIGNEKTRVKKYNYSKYHNLFIFPHQCSHIHNKTNCNGRKIIISCDSQLIPSLPVLCIFFEDVWIFDNRTDKMPIDNRSYEKTTSIFGKLEDIRFTDVLISLWNKPLNNYIDINLK